MSAAAEPVPNRYTHRIESYQEPALVGFYTVSETPPNRFAQLFKRQTRGFGGRRYASYGGG
jgi:hypothetical protein